MIMSNCQHIGNDLRRKPLLKLDQLSWFNARMAVVHQPSRTDKQCVRLL